MFIFPIELKFQSTPSVGKATYWLSDTQGLIKISIHAFRGEGDLKKVYQEKWTKKFQSTPSVGKATQEARGVMYR